MGRHRRGDPGCLVVALTTHPAGWTPEQAPLSSQLKCNRCGYTWEYNGSLQQATCPSCAAKVPVERNELAEPLERLAEEYDLSVEELRELLERAHGSDR